MKTLEKSFTANCDKIGETVFTQVKRDGNVALYKREWPDGRLHSYEVFVVKRVEAGAKLPGGGVVPESYERYPSSNSFGKYAYGVTTMERAEFRFDQLQKYIADKTARDEAYTEANEGVPSRRGRKAAIRPEIIIPGNSRWVMKELLTVNPAWSQPMLYVNLQTMIKAGKVKCVGEHKIAGQKGKPSKIYSKV